MARAGVFDDIDAAVSGCMARLEWIALQILANTTLSLTKTNNSGKVTETSIDFQMPAASKRILETATATRKWTTGTAAQILPITDFRAASNAARALGFRVNWALMNWTNFQYFIGSDQVTQLVAPFMGYGNLHTASFAAPPTVEAVNAFLRSQELPQIILIDTLVKIETNAHTQTNTDPWTTKYVTFLEEMEAGVTYNGPIMEEK